METFNFIVERKVVTWETIRACIEAETEEEALERCKKEDYDEVISSEIDYEWIDVLPPSDNEHNATFIISQPDGTVLYENGL